MTRRVLEQRQRTTLYLDTDGETPVVLKVLRDRAPSAADLAAFHNELTLTQDLEVGGVRRGLGRERVDGQPALVLAWVPGEPLTGWSVRSVEQVEEGLRIAVELAAILDRVHGEGIIHADLNPSNVIYESVGHALTLIDFGLATRFDRKLTSDEPGMLGGTLRYIAPEQTGRVDRTMDHRADLYSLGATLYHLFSGAPPFDLADPLELVHAHIARRPKPLDQACAWIEPPLSRVVMRLLEKNPEDRYQSARGVRADLETCLADLRRSGAMRRFELGREDVPSGLRVPEKLYGREAAVATLVETWERAAGGAVELALVGGGAGVGKSSLARAVRTAAALPRVLWAEGKCDRGNPPYAAIGRALERVIDRLLAEPPERVEALRTRMREEIGGLGNVLAPIVPSVGQLVDLEEDAKPLGEEEAEHRFQFVFRTFVRALCRPDQLLVLFLDDLQWAGPETLDLVEALATDGAAGHLVIVGAYRDEDTSALDRMCELLEGQRARVTRIALPPLGREALVALLVETLGSNAEELAALTTLVERKTQGNPFAIRQFLSTLYEEGVIRFDVERHRWDWDTSEAAALRIPDNVVELLRQRLERLAPEAVRGLRDAACIGPRFTLDALAALRDEPASETARSLAPAITNGLVMPLGAAARVIGSDAEEAAFSGVGLAFAHDRLHEAALELSDDAERRSIHLRLGRWLRDQGDAPRSDERTFEVVRHLLAGVDGMDDPDERAELVLLTLEASRLAMRSAASDQALAWLRRARELLPEDAWERDYPLALAISTELAEVACAAEDLEALDAAATEVEGRAKRASERARVVIARLKALIAGDQLEEAVALGLAALEALDVRFPRSPGVPNLILATLSVKWALLGKPVEQLAHQEEMTDERVLAALHVLEKVAPAAFRVGGKLYPLIVLRIVQLTARYGAVPVSAFGYGGYALTLAGVLGDIDGGYAYGAMAKALADRFGDDRHRGSASSIFEMFIRHWKEPLSRSLDPFIEAWRLSASTGRVFEASWAQCYRLLWMEAAGIGLASVSRNLASWHDAMRGDAGAERLARMLGRFVACLEGEAADPTVLTGGDYDEQETLDHGDETERAFYHQYKLRLALLFGDDAGALEHAAELEARMEALTSMPADPVARLYISLARLRAGDPRWAKATIKKLGVFATHCPANYAHKQALLEAELAAHRGRRDLARLAYDRAVSGAREHGFLQEEALALTLASAFYAREGSPLASILAAEARRAWRELGAVKVLDVVGEPDPTPRLLPQNGATVLTTTTDSARGSVDLTSVVRSAALVGAELQMDRLLERLLELVLQNAGADRALLFLASEEGLVLEAETTGEGVVRTGMHLPISSVREVCLPVIREVEHLREPFRIADAAADPDLATDPHAQASGVRSILGVPFVAGGRLRALAYLENHLTAGAFTAEKVQTLTLLASQVVFSLTNAQLYGELESAYRAQLELSRASDRFVPQGFIESIGHSSIVDVRLGDSVRKEMSVMFTDIRGFTSLMEGLPAGENIGFVNSFLRFAEPAILNNDGFVVEYLGDAILALFDTPDQVVRAGVDMRKALPTLNARRAATGAAPVDFGLGANTAMLTLGVIGGPERIKAGVLGDGVNLAARVESLTKHYQVGMLISGQTKAGLVDPGRWCLRPIDRVRVKGRNEPVELFEVFDPDEEPVRDAKRRVSARYEEGWAAYVDGRFREASQAFATCREALPDDRPLAILAERCARYEARPPEPWTGVEVLDFK
ncbi:MAG: AAA family ATPase [Myxococcales bacterium]|nr:AAA family ATPase [Myxococcales bacterium]